MKSWVILLLVWTIALTASADVKTQLELENLIRARVAGVLQTVEPRVQVVVEVRLKKGTLTLPGTAGSVRTDDIPLEKIAAANVEAVRVSVWSESDIPKVVQTRIESVLGLPASTKLIWNYRLYAAEEKAWLQNAERPLSHQSLETIATPLGKMSQVFEGAKESSRVALVGISIVLICCALLLSFMSYKNIQIIQFGLKSISQSIDTSASGGSGADLSALMQQQQIMAGPEKRSETGKTDSAAVGPFRGWSVSSLVALLSDCYWCERDGYAKWIWLHLEAEQRPEVLSSWMPSRNYISQILSVSEVFESFHLDPYYLSPADLKMVDNQRLRELVAQDSGLWLTLSPLRRQSVPLSLPEQMKIASLEPSSNLRVLPTLPSSPLREMQAQFNWSQMSEDDENYLLENFSSIPATLWPQVPSFVWLSKQEETKRRELLEGMTAAQIAAVWVGPASVLESIASALPEKKRASVLDYQSRLKPSRQHPAMKKVMAFANLEPSEHVAQAS